MEDKKREVVELQIPSKAIRIQHAMCSRGHSLMNEKHTINGYASVTVKVKFQDKEGLIHLDPIYGSFKNIYEVDIPEKAVVQVFCPECGVSLEDVGQTCHSCSAPMFALLLPHGGIIEGCMRNGCQFHFLKLADADELLDRLNQNHILDAYL